MTPRPRKVGHPQSRVAVAAVVLFALVAAGCSSKEDPLEIGFRRVSLDLVFKDATKAPPVEPQQVVQVIEFFDQEFPGFADSLQEEEEEEPAPEPTPRPRRPVPPRADAEEPCIPAPEGAVSDEPVFATVKDPPKVGSYTRHNAGTIGFEIPPLPPGTLRYPPTTKWDITDVVIDRGTVATNPKEDAVLGELPQSPATPEVVRFTLTRNVSASLKTIDTYQYYLDRGDADLDNSNLDGDGIYLVRREIRSSTLGNSVFTPTPPVMIAPIDEESEDSEVQTSAGIDRENNAAMSVTSKVIGRAYIDACGDVIDTYTVQWEEQFVDLSGGTPSVSGNVESGKPNIWNISFSKNLLLAREEMHTVLRSTTASTPPLPVVLKFDYVSTLAFPEPKPIKAPTTPGPGAGGQDSGGDEGDDDDAVFP